MKWLLFCFVLAALVRCRKSDQPVANYLRLTIDGVQVSATRDISTYSNLNIYAGWANGGELTIEIHNFRNTTGEWTVNPDYTTSPRFSLFENGVGYYAGDGAFNSNPQQGSGKVIISQVDDKYVKGTFAFISAEDIATHIKKTATDGEFYIKRTP